MAVPDSPAPARFVIGTAGHVDHGKSTLVRALTGVDPERLREEKARQMTIDLGFAWLDLDSLGLVGIIDMPGHRDFIENMLAGVGGIRAVLLVIAADEGLMPQTREHLNILRLLGVSAGIIVLSKTDLAPDEEWLQLLALEIAEATADTPLANAPLVRVSARTGMGIEALRQAIADLLLSLPDPANLAKPRLWVDRAFSISGFGTVVTGTLLDGPLALGQEVALVGGPNNRGDLHGRVRGLQTHHQTLNMAAPGSRVAVNVAGVERASVQRGMLLTLPGQIEVASLATARLNHLADAPRPLLHNAEVKIFVGAAEAMARVRLLEGDQLPAGEQGWVQLVLRTPLPISRGDRFILRYPSPGQTFGGGEILAIAGEDQTSVLGKYYLRRNRPDVIAQLEALAAADPVRLLVGYASSPLSADQLAAKLDLPPAQTEAAIEMANARSLILPLAGPDTTYWLTPAALASYQQQLAEILGDFHGAEPLKPAFSAEKVRAKISLTIGPYEALLAHAVGQNWVARTGKGPLALPGRGLRWSKSQKAAIDSLMKQFRAAPYTPPSYKEAAGVVGEPVLEALIGLDELRQVSAEVLLLPATYDQWLTAVQAILASEGRVNVRWLRDIFNTSRKYALAFLESLNQLGLTARDGDDHILA
jgi:selenocysteine-specific elongation factor